ncbi:MAG TPA: hypothetical protein VMU67_05920 [Steroidobacteraceae bacterium]|nr:hypothetical protein [Steroidobacteraceae bacterium]
MHEHQPEPECFHDLHLDQIVASITAGREAYSLDPFFRTPLQHLGSITYRHEVFRDLEDATLSSHIASFASRMCIVRERLAQSGKAHYVLQKHRWFLDAAGLYCEAAAELLWKLSEARPRSRGLLEFAEYLGAYLGSSGFLSMRDEASRLAAELNAIEYDLQLEGTRIEVRLHEAAPDYGAEVSKTFAKFAQAAAREHQFRFHQYPEMNHIEAAILDRVALLFPRPFSDLGSFWARYHQGVFDAVIERFDRQVQFYCAYREHVARMRSAGCEFCYPEVIDRSKEVRAEAMVDLALAGTLVTASRQGAGRSALITNDLYLEGTERIFVVTGANQGGKTTVARAFGQLHYLAALGCPVPAREARLLLFDELFTHFEREESAESLVGKLEDELLRMRRILQAATPRSILIMNETFGSTTLEDARLLGKAVLREIIAKDMLCVCVTFVEELASLDAATVSMVAGVDPNDPAVRTFRIVREPANGLAYALAIARKYGLTDEEVRARIAGRSVRVGAVPVARGSEAGRDSHP